MTSSLVVATANVQCDLDQAAAGTVLDAVLARRPDLVGLQEWALSRAGLLRRIGDVALSPGPGIPGRVGGSVTAPDGEYAWVQPLLGGCPVGVRTARFELVRRRAVLLDRPGRVDRGARALALDPGHVAGMAVCRDRVSGAEVALLSFHLAYGVQSDGAYRAERPRLVARHRATIARLEREIAGQLARGRAVYAVGDGNLDGLRLAGLTSAWTGREGAPGTLGATRKVDDVFGPRAPTSVEALTTASDHAAVVASWE